MIATTTSATSAIMRSHPVAIMRPQAAAIPPPDGRRCPVHFRNTLSTTSATATSPSVRLSAVTTKFSNLMLARFSAPLDATE